MAAPHTADLTCLIELVARLRAPDGCPWDREQQLGDVRAYLIEEAHEAAAALDSGDWAEISSELGDLLFQIAFIGRLGEEAGVFHLAEAIEGARRKMIGRHPHVFGDAELADSQAVREAWERRKLEEGDGKASLLGGLAASLPSLTAAYRMTQKAAGVGFDWPDAAAVLDKLEEEKAELAVAMAPADPAATDGAAVREEIGDLLFTVVNLARKLSVDPEAALAAANRKFRRRFESIEAALAERGTGLAEASLEEMETLWQETKT